LGVERRLRRLAEEAGRLWTTASASRRTLDEAARARAHFGRIDAARVRPGIRPTRRTARRGGRWRREGLLRQRGDGVAQTALELVQMLVLLLCLLEMLLLLREEEMGVK